MQSCGAGEDQRDGPRPEPGQAVAAKSVSQRDRVVFLGSRLGLVDRGLHALAHRPSTPVVQALGEEPGVHDVRRSQDRIAQLADDDLAANQQDSHVGCNVDESSNKVGTRAATPADE